MLTSSMLQHSFDISVAVRAVHNLLAANWVGVHATAFVQSDRTGVPFELSGWNFQRSSRINWATKWCWQQFFCNFSSHMRWQLRIILNQTIYEYSSPYPFLLPLFFFPQNWQDVLPTKHASFFCHPISEFISFLDLNFFLLKFLFLDLVFFFVIRLLRFHFLDRNRRFEGEGERECSRKWWKLFLIENPIRIFWNLWNIRHWIGIINYLTCFSIFFLLFKSKQQTVFK